MEAHLILALVSVSTDSTFPRHYIRLYPGIVHLITDLNPLEACVLKTAANTRNGNKPNRLLIKCIFYAYAFGHPFSHVFRCNIYAKLAPVA